jgi:hypothetical protein
LKIESEVLRPDLDASLIGGEVLGEFTQNFVYRQSPFKAPEKVLVDDSDDETFPG